SIHDTLEQEIKQKEEEKKDRPISSAWRRLHSTQPFIQIYGDMVRHTHQVKDSAAKSRTPLLAKFKNFSPRWPGYDISHPSIVMGSGFKGF
ncbi:hypothetical protein, partial [Escherichia coli]|uniref:hypothetical protein n=1 Tax=Escherichia coli TaxID=562 RepID=UPI002000A3D8